MESGIFFPLDPFGAFLVILRSRVGYELNWECVVAADASPEWKSDAL
jgi:hypothetical protein